MRLHTFFTGNINSNLLKALLFILIAASFSACGGDDDLDNYYFDTEKQKELDEAIIRKYFRDNDVDTTAVVKTATGLYYWRTTEGTGDLLKNGDVVDVHYIGRVPSNEIFDNSYNRGETFPVTIGISSVIQGWHEGLKLMKEGEEGFLYIPSHLAYGYNPRHSLGNMVLIFDMKVVNKR